VVKTEAEKRIMELLELLGAENLKENYNYVSATPFCHENPEGKGKDAWSYNHNLHLWRCWSDSCETKYGGDIIGLVRSAKKCSFPDAVKFLVEFLNCDIKDIKDIDIPKKNKFEQSFIKKHAPAEKTPPKIFAELKKIYHDYFEKRGFKKSTIEYFDVTYSDMGKFAERMVIPIHDIDGNLIAYTARTIHEDYDKRKMSKWMHSWNFRSSETLFNIDRAKKSIKEKGEIVLVEGPLDVFRLHEAGIENACAIMGSSFSEWQKVKVLTLAQSVVIGVDSDSAGKKAAYQIENKLKDYVDLYILNIPDGKKDVGELSVEIVKLLYKNKIRI
jgi:DNA primase